MKHYKNLNIDQSASLTEIKLAYRKLALTYHPDVNNSPEATKRFIEIQTAYEILSNPSSRSTYDRMVSQGIASRQESALVREHINYQNNGRRTRSNPDFWETQSRRRAGEEARRQKQEFEKNISKKPFSKFMIYLGTFLGFLIGFTFILIGLKQFFLSYNGHYLMSGLLFMFGILSLGAAVYRFLEFLKLWIQK